MKVKTSLKAKKGYVVVKRRNKSHTKCRLYLVQKGRKKEGKRDTRIKARQG
jgi:hypothetical protein